ncbi:MAG: YdcF family protein [Kiritimatiellia bacterium]
MIRLLLKILSVFVLLPLVWLFALGGTIWGYGMLDRAEKSDCVIVLGAAAYGNRPSPVFEERIRHGIALYRSGTVARLIFTGGFGEGASHAESEVAAAYAVRAGVPASAILTENRSRTTQQNLAEARALMDAQGLRTAILVSDPLHMRRAIWQARDLEMQAVSSPTPTSRFRSWRTRWRFLRRELYYWHYYLFTGQ